MARTFEKAEEEGTGGERSNLGIGRSSADAPELPFRDMKDILFNPSDKIAGEGELSQDREFRRQESQQELSLDLQDAFGVSLEDLDTAIKELYQADLETLDELNILRFIAEAMRVQTLQNKINLDQESAISVFLNDIATAVEPPTDIVVSGTVDVDKPDVPQEVLEDLDQVRTRMLIIKANPFNNKPIYFGDDAVEPRDGFVLVPGEKIELPISYRDAQVYMASEERGASLQLLGLI